MNVFKKTRWKPSYNDGDDNANCTKQLVNEEIKKGKSVSSVVVLREVDTSANIALMPNGDEYDLEEQLKAGVKPQQLDVRGVLADSPNVQEMVNVITKPFDNDGDDVDVNDVINDKSE